MIVFVNLEVLQEHDLLYAKLKVEKPSIYLKEVKNTLASFANVHVSLSTICKSFKHNINEGSWTRKVLVNPYGERFTPHDMQYTKAYLNFISRQNPYKLLHKIICCDNLLESPPWGDSNRPP